MAYLYTLKSNNKYFYKKTKRAAIWQLFLFFKQFFLNKGNKPLQKVGLQR